ncbi:MAG: peptide deformylase [Actinomycetota bacterium]|jgi:peptide deformylase|nr:peptide deformylase [Actinomycetota bacterium]
MAVLPILISGDPVLHTPASRVTKFDRSLTTLVADMFDTMEAAPGVGLAAPQVGVPLRVFVYNWTDGDDVLWRGTAINPELWITPTPVGEADEETESEGCLSIPGERYGLRRSPNATLRATTLDGTKFEITTDGWLARIFQHEFDHLDGILYADRLDYASAKAVGKVLKKRGWGVPDQSWTPGIDHLED